MTTSVRDERARPRHDKSGERRRLASSVVLKARRMGCGRIPQSPVDACVYRVTSKEKVIVADGPGGEQRVAFRQRGFEGGLIGGRASKDTEIKRLHVSEARFPTDCQSRLDIIEG